LPVTTLTLVTTTFTVPVTTLTLPVTTTFTVPITTLTLPVTTLTLVTTTFTVPVTTLTLPVTTTFTVPITTLTLPVTTLTFSTTTLTRVTSTTAVPSTTITLVTTTTTPTPSTTSTTLPPTTAPLFDLALTLRPARTPSSVPEQLGAALAVKGDTFLIGAPRDGSAVPDAGIVYVVGASSSTFGQLLRVLRKPGTPAAGDAFGAAVVAAGDGVLVGAPGDDTAAPGGGAAFVFGPGDAAPTTLLPPTPAAEGAFGAAVAAAGSNPLVGAPGTGTVYLFRGGTGEPVLTLESPGGAGRFGSAIATVGANVLVGAPGTGGEPGEAFLFGGGTGRLQLTLTNPLPAAGDQFGFAVATAGSRLLIGAPGDHDGAGAVFLFAFNTGELIRTFTKPTPRAGDRFGASIAVTQAGVLVGAPSDSELAAAGGAAYQFDLQTGELRGVLRKDEPRAGDLFGTAVAAVGARVLVGAPGDDAGLVDGGAAYLFSSRLEAVFRKRLSAAAFGTSVATAGADLLVGAPGGGSGAGAVSRFDGATGGVLATLESPAPGHPGFGFSVAALGNNVVAGAPFLATAGGGDVGAVYRFAGTALAGTLVDPTPLGGDQFGFSIATVGTDVVVGVPLAGARDTGLAYLLDGPSGALRVTFQKPIPVAGDFFGAAVAAEGDEVLVGAPLDSETAPKAGAAYLFRRDTATLDRTFQSPAPAAGDLFGAAVALSGPRVVIGAPQAAGGATDAGTVYVFDRASGNLLVTIPSPMPHRGDQFGSAVAVAGENLLVGAELDDTGAPDTGAAYLFDAGTGALLQRFLNPAQGAFDHFGFALAAGPSGLLVGAPGPSRVYVFRPAPQAAQALRTEAVAAAAGRALCGNGIVEPGEECDDGNRVDTDDCRNDCTRTVCCTLDPLEQARCDDNDPCTDDSFDPATGCSHVPNGRCCQSDADCGSGRCRVCDGCFLYPWDCCAQGSTCLALSPECGGTTCLAAAYCRCEGGLECPGEAVPSRAQTLFAAACDQVRLGGSLAPAETPSRRELLRAAKSHARAARRMIRKAARATRKMMARGGVSKGCGSTLLARIKSVKKAIPRGRELRRCVLTH